MEDLYRIKKERIYEVVDSLKSKINSRLDFTPKSICDNLDTFRDEILSLPLPARTEQVLPNDYVKSQITEPIQQETSDPEIPVISEKMIRNSCDILACHYELSIDDIKAAITNYVNGKQQPKSVSAEEIRDKYSRQWFNETDDIDDPNTGYMAWPDVLKAMKEYERLNRL